MSDRETKTLAEASNSELLEEVASRCESYAIGVIFHADKNQFRICSGGRLLGARGLGVEVSAHTERQVQATMKEQ